MMLGLRELCASGNQWRQQPPRLAGHRRAQDATLSPGVSVNSEKGQGLWR